MFSCVIFSSSEFHLSVFLISNCCCPCTKHKIVKVAFGEVSECMTSQFDSLNVVRLGLLLLQFAAEKLWQGFIGQTSPNEQQCGAPVVVHALLKGEKLAAVAKEKMWVFCGEKQHSCARNASTTKNQEVR